MSLNREQIEHLERFFLKNEEKPWKNNSHSRKWAKKQMNKFIRLQGKKIEDDDTGGKVGRKPLHGWEW